VFEELGDYTVPKKMSKLLELSLVMVVQNKIIKTAGLYGSLSIYNG